MESWDNKDKRNKFKSLGTLKILLNGTFERIFGNKIKEKGILILSKERKFLNLESLEQKFLNNEFSEFEC